MGRMLTSSYYDISERLNFYWTCLVVVVFVSAVTVVRFFSLGSLISCWTPAHFTFPYVRYSQELCWLNDKYYPSRPDQLLPDRDRRLTESLNAYHTHIPLILVFMVFGFQFPRLAKWIIDVFIGYNTEESVSKNGEGKAEDLTAVIRESRHRSAFIRTLSFFLVKLLVLLNLLFQFIYLSVTFRETVERDTNSTDVTRTSAIFPKVILCDFQILQLQTVQRFSLQCVMPVNNLYEQFIMLFWYWIIGLGIFTSLVFVAQLVSLVVPPFTRIRFRGIIPEGELNQKGFGIDDALLFLLEVQQTSGVAMARRVATILYQSPGTTAATGDNSQARALPSTDIPMSDMAFSNDKEQLVVGTSCENPGFQ